ncbi:MAG: hypothetical protein JWL81_1478 [Verrucomicrobiales bacterium]|nr:hypothetical protein [Verrucomicrobiales bacterium]
MIRILRVFLLLGWGLSATAGRAWALQDDTGRVAVGEVEETPDMLPEQVIPWHESLSELPEWMSREELEVVSGMRPANHGGGLFPESLWAQEPEPQQGPLIRDEALRLAGGKVRGEAGEPAAVPLGAELLALYTGERPGRVFVDPQHLVARSEEQMESLVQRWLNEQCVFRTTVLVFGPGQQLPAEFDPQALRRRWFGESEEALLVFYFYGQPERTLAIFGSGARLSYGESLLRGVVDAAVAEAGRVSGSAEQLERFCYKMSVRLHWLARTRSLAGADAGREAASVKEAAARRPWAVTLMIILAWVAGAMAVGFGLVAWKKRGLAAGGWKGRVAGGIGQVAAVWKSGWKALKNRGDAGAGEAVVFPDLEVCPRLGAPHCGGFSAVISFSPTGDRVGGC